MGAFTNYIDKKRCVGNPKNLTFCEHLKGSGVSHGLRTPNEDTNQRYLKNWADMANKYALAVPEKLGVGLNFWPCSESYSSLGIRSQWGRRSKKAKNVVCERPSFS